ncbi:hypothetical protein [uncultured Amnibacterium sp.]|uniref:hypothetical protein n=1 Tax=uncultured Amnibacterium sp. TaxID=1631851 RepID=UPI0035CBAC8A
MALRRAFFAWQFAAAAVLPIWLLLGYAVWGTGVAGLFGILLLVPVVVLVELGLALLFSARAGVRRSRTLDLPAIGVLAAFQVGVIGVGFFGPATAWFGLLAVAAAIGGFWLGGALLVRDVRSRVEATMASFGRPPAGAPRSPIDAGEYIVIKPAAR